MECFILYLDCGFLDLFTNLQDIFDYLEENVDEYYNDNDICIKEDIENDLLNDGEYTMDTYDYCDIIKIKKIKFTVTSQVV